jgi:hypothetical protein
MQAKVIHTRGLQKGADSWAHGLMQRLLQLTHRQWLYFNARVHMKVKDGLRIAQHNTILMRMEECLHIDSTDLLVEDQVLLETEFDKLTHGPTLDKLEWMAEMDTAQGAADHIAKGSRHALHSCYCSGPNPHMRMEYKDVLVDWDGSIEWRRQGKRFHPLCSL